MHTDLVLDPQRSGFGMYFDGPAGDGSFVSRVLERVQRIGRPQDGIFDRRVIGIKEDFGAEFQTLENGQTRAQRRRQRQVGEQQRGTPLLAHPQFNSI